MIKAEVSNTFKNIMAFKMYHSPYKTVLLFFVIPVAVFFYSLTAIPKIPIILASEKYFLIGLVSLFIILKYYLNIIKYIFTVLKATKLSNVALIEYVFDESELVVRLYQENVQREERRPYDSLVRAAESKSYFFLYIDKKAAYVIPKSSIVCGSYIDLREFLKRNLTYNKYVQDCKE